MDRGCFEYDGLGPDFSPVYCAFFIKKAGILIKDRLAEISNPPQKALWLWYKHRTMNQFPTVVKLHHNYRRGVLTVDTPMQVINVDVTNEAIESA
jgi:hypothetical protein